MMNLSKSRLFSRNSFSLCLSVIFAGLSFFSPQLTHAELCIDLFKALSPAVTGTGSAPSIWRGALASSPRAIVISAPSGTGKSTLINMLLNEFPNDFVLGVNTTYTTRPPRPGETSGYKAYHFITTAEWLAMRNRGEFIEEAEIAGNYYGTSRSAVMELLASGKSVILDKSVEGAAAIRRELGARQISLFIRPPNLQVLEQRLRGRGTESEEKVRERLARAQSELAEVNKYDLVIVNDDLHVAYRDFVTALEAVPPQKP